MRIAVIGVKGTGSFALRGEPLLKEFSAEFIEAGQVRELSKHYDLAFVVKRRVGGKPPIPRNVREQCERVIFDPLDYWSSNERSPTRRFWKSIFAQCPANDVLGTSPAAVHEIEGGAPQPRIWHVPHQCDSRIPYGYDPSGPVTYAGDPRFIARYYRHLKAACKLIGKPFRMVNSRRPWFDLTGSSLVLALRMPPTNTSLNRTCKPQVKVENAIAAGIPVLITGFDAEVSAHPSAATLSGKFCQPGDLAESMKQAIAQGPLTDAPFREHDYLDRIQEIVEYPNYRNPKPILVTAADHRLKDYMPFWMGQATKFGYEYLTYDLGSLGSGIPFDPKGDPTEGFSDEFPQYYKAAFKPRVILDAIKRSGRPVIWLDADCIVTQRMDNLTRDCDVAVTIRRRQEWERIVENETYVFGKIMSGASYWNDTPEAIGLLTKWIDAIEEYESDQTALNAVVNPPLSRNSRIKRHGAIVALRSTDEFNNYYLNDRFNVNATNRHYRSDFRRKGYHPRNDFSL